MNYSIEAHRLRARGSTVGRGQQADQQGRGDRGVLRYDGGYIFRRHDGRVRQLRQQRLEDLKGVFPARLR